VTSPSLSAIARAICCPTGCRNGASHCRADMEQVTVNPKQAAQAVALLYCEMWKAWQEKSNAAIDITNA
jgi:hypothetical protein